MGWAICPLSIGIYILKIDRFSKYWENIWIIFLESLSFEDRNGARRRPSHASPSPNCFVWGGQTRVWIVEVWELHDSCILSTQNGADVDRRPYLAARVLSTLPSVAGSKIRPTSMRVSSWRMVGYYSMYTY